MNRCWIAVMIGTIIIMASAYGQQLDTHDDLQALIDQREDRPYVLIDVRTPVEFQRGHIPTASNTPHNQIGATPPTDDKDALIILYCASGIRSNYARRVLERAGYRNIVDFGGIGNWRGEIVSETD